MHHQVVLEKSDDRQIEKPVEAHSQASQVVQLPRIEAYLRPAR